MVDIFFAVNLSEDVKSIMHQALHHSSIQDPPWRWIRPENLHITLKFLGEMEDAAVDDLARCAAIACSETAPFHVSFTAFGGFPNLSKPRVLFYRADEGSQELRTVAGRVEQVLHESLGIAKERKPFRPHVTVARIKKPLPGAWITRLEGMAPLESAAQAVTHIHLMRSELRREGARYQAVKEIALGSGKW